MAAQQRIELLDTVAPAYWRLLEPILSRPESVPGQSAHHSGLEALQRLVQDLGFGYKIALNDSRQRTLPLVGRGKLAHRAALLAVQYLGQHLLHRYAAYQRAPSSLWREIDQIFRYSVARGFHRDTLTGWREKRLSMECAFKTVAMLRMADPYRLEEVEEAIRLVQSFDPPGIACHDLRQSLLLQLDVLEEPADSLTRRVVEECWDLFLRRQFPAIA